VHHPQPENAEAVDGEVSVAVCSPRAEGGVVPSAATDGASRAIAHHPEADFMVQIGVGVETASGLVREALVE